MGNSNKNPRWISIWLFYEFWIIDVKDFNLPGFNQIFLHPQIEFRQKIWIYKFVSLNRLHLWRNLIQIRFSIKTLYRKELKYILRRSYFIKKKTIPKNYFKTNNMYSKIYNLYYFFIINPNAYIVSTWINILVMIKR